MSDKSKDQSIEMAKARATGMLDAFLEQRGIVIRFAGDYMPDGTPRKKEPPVSDQFDEEAAGEAHRSAQDAYHEQVEVLQRLFPAQRKVDLLKALYTFNERGYFWDDVELGIENALKAWALVERIKAEGFPDDLRM